MLEFWLDISFTHKKKVLVVFDKFLNLCVSIHPRAVIALAVQVILSPLTIVNKTGHSQGHLVSVASCYGKEVTNKNIFFA